jgi:hypothetical protein
VQTAEYGSTLAFEIRAIDTFIGTLALPTGDVAPTGRTIEMSGAESIF